MRSQILFLAAALNVHALPQLDPRDATRSQCWTGIYGECATILADYDVAQKYCSSKYPVPCETKPELPKMKRTEYKPKACKKRLDKSNADLSTIIPSEDQLSAWSKVMAQPSSIVESLCACIETPVVCPPYAKPGKPKPHAYTPPSLLTSSSQAYLAPSSPPKPGSYAHYASSAESAAAYPTAGYIHPSSKTSPVSMSEHVSSWAHYGTPSKEVSHAQSSSSSASLSEVPSLSPQHSSQATSSIAIFASTSTTSSMVLSSTSSSFITSSSFATSESSLLPSLSSNSVVLASSSLVPSSSSSSMATSVSSSVPSTVTSFTSSIASSTTSSAFTASSSIVPLPCNFPNQTEFSCANGQSFGSICGARVVRANPPNAAFLFTTNPPEFTDCLSDCANNDYCYVWSFSRDAGGNTCYLYQNVFGDGDYDVAYDDYSVRGYYNGACPS